MSFLNLKHIPCPAGNTCTAFHCLFGHGKDRDASATASSGTQPARSSHKRPENAQSPSQEPARKRLRTERDAAETQSPSPAAPRPGQTISPTEDGLINTTRPISPTEDGLINTTRPISPPPLKRKGPSSTSTTATLTASDGVTSRGHVVNHKQSAASPAARLASLPSTPRSSGNLTSSNLKTPSTSASKTPATIAPSPATPIAKAAPRKVESLNPRLLKQAPASFDTRIRMLKLLHSEFSRLNNELRKEIKKTPKDEDDRQNLICSDQDLIWRALDEEEKAAVDKPSIYSNVLRNFIMQYKRMTVKQWEEERRAERQALEQKAHPDKKLGAVPKKVHTGLTPDQEVKFLGRLLTPIKDLAGHGYVSSVPTDADIQKAREGLEAAQGWEKCDRCTKRFQVFPGRRDEDGALASGGTCHHHWGKTYVPARPPGDKTRVAKRYRCCGQEVGDSVGCTENAHHVFKVSDPKRLAAILNFAETPANPNVPENRAVCFDCEMCYTVHGLELVRVTATSWPSGQELLDVLVIPIGEILDLNSRFSGVWPDDMAQAVPWTERDTLKPGSKKTNPTNKGAAKKPMSIVSSPEVARDLFFSLISPETPVIGHGLENDLNSLRVVHPTLVDTVLLHPHKHGLPYRYGLKMLMDTLLNRKIQVETEGKVEGHDSGEDARAAGELVHLRVMEKWKDMQYQGWKVDGTTLELVPPPDLSAPTGPPRLTAEFLEAAQ